MSDAAVAVLPPRKASAESCPEVLAHLSAAQHYGLWLPECPDWLPTLRILPPGVQRPRQRGLYVFRSRAAGVDSQGAADVAVPVAACLGQLAEDLGVLDLVIALDSALSLGRATLADIDAATVPRQRGLPRLHQALDLADGRSESPWESALRVLHVVSGIDVEPQSTIRASSSAVIARADLRIAGTRRLAEYDGGVHRDPDQHHKDLARDKALARDGWERFGYVAREIVSNPIRIIRDAEEALGWPHDPDRLDAWRRLVNGSTLTPNGRSLLARRLQRFTRQR